MFARHLPFSRRSIAIAVALVGTVSLVIGAEAAFNKTRVAISKASDGEQVPSVSSSLLEDVKFGMADAGS